MTRPQNCLNQHVTYLTNWNIEAAFREIIQNAVDGAVEWLEPFENKGKSDIRPAGKGWYTSKCIPPKKFRDAGFGHGGKAELILTISKDEEGAWSKPPKMKNWHRDSNSLAYIKIQYSSRKEIGWTDFLENGRQPPNTCIASFDTVNRVVPKFRMTYLVGFGLSSKKDKVDAAGKFGEGFKVAALEAARKGYTIVVEVNGRRRSYVMKRRWLCYKQQNSQLSKEAMDHPKLIFFRLKLGKPWERAVTGADHRFNPCIFRLLSPGVAYSKSGAALTSATDKGSLYCMGIFVAKINDLLRGYDIPSKDFIKGRDRNGTSIEFAKLRELMLPLIKSKSKIDEGFMPSLLQDMLALSEPEARTCHEVLSLFGSKALCQNLAKCFREEKGDDAFPCLACEQDEMENALQNRTALILPANIVSLLQEGGYRSVQEELDFLFSDANKIVLCQEEEPLVESSLFRLNRVDECFQINREDVVFVNGHFLSSIKANSDCCQLKGGKFYVSQVKDFDINYSDENDFTSPFYTFEWKSKKPVLEIVVCENLLRETEEIWVTQTESSKVVKRFSLTGLCTELLNDYNPGIEYSFSAMSKGEHIVFDPLTQKACVLTEVMTDVSLDGGYNSLTESQQQQYLDAIGDGGSVSDGLAQFGLSASDGDSIGDDLTQDELVSVFGGSCEDCEGGEEEVSSSESEPETKRPRKALAKDLASAQFGQITVNKGQVYTAGNQIVRVLEFTGRRLPRGAVCEIICSLEVAIRHTPGLGGNRVADFQGYPKERIAYQMTQKGSKFLESLSDYDGREDFDEMHNQAYFELKVSQDKRQSNFFVELRRRNLDPPESPPVPIGQKPREAVLFAGVGGSSEGDKQAGFDLSWLVEINSLAAASLRGSHKYAMIYEEDVQDFLDNCRDEKTGYPQKGEVDHLSSSPPCQGFSRKNRGGQNDGANNMLSLEVVRGVDILRPRTGVLENVTGMLLEKHLEFRGKIMLGLLNYGYQIRIAVHNAIHFGDPQNRKRVIFTYSRGDTPLPSMPEPTHTDETAMTLRQALSGLSAHCDCRGPGSSPLPGLYTLPNGTLTYNHVASIPVKEAHVLDEDKPVNTILTQHTNGFVHPRNSKRTLSIRELARLFSFPDDKQFFGSMTAMRKQVGNSVPVKLAYSLSYPAIAMYTSHLHANIIQTMMSLAAIRLHFLDAV